MSVEGARDEASVGTVDSRRVASAAGSLRRPYIRLTTGRAGAAFGVSSAKSMLPVSESTRKNGEGGCRSARTAAWARKLWRWLGVHSERRSCHLPGRHSVTLRVYGSYAVTQHLWASAAPLGIR